MKLKSIVAGLTALVALSACGNDNSPQLHDDRNVVEYLGSTIHNCSGTDKVDCEATLKFRDIASDATFSDRTGVGKALHRLGWLDKYQCYTLPLDEDQHQEVPCG